jgi:hypothetical protein
VSWKAYLEGREADLEMLGHQFDQGPEVIGRGDDGCWVTSSRFEGLVDPVDVQRVARRALAEMNGAAALFDANYQPGGLTDRFRDGNGPEVIVANAKIAASFHMIAKGEVRDGNGELISPAQPSTPGQYYVSVAARDRHASEVLELLSEPPADWVALYKVYEVIEAEGDLPRWASNAEFKAFTASANRPSVGGSGARHAREQPGTPKKTITLAEGQEFIKRVVIVWIASK